MAMEYDGNIYTYLWAPSSLAAYVFVMWSHLQGLPTTDWQTWGISVQIRMLSWEAKSPMGWHCGWIGIRIWCLKYRLFCCMGHAQAPCNASTAKLETLSAAQTGHPQFVLQCIGFGSNSVHSLSLVLGKWLQSPGSVGTSMQHTVQLCIAFWQSCLYSANKLTIVTIYSQLGFHLCVSSEQYCGSCIIYTPDHDEEMGKAAHNAVILKLNRVNDG